MSSSAFPLPLNIFDDPNRPNWWVLAASFDFASPSLGLITVEAGFDTDFASVPRALWALYPPTGSYRRAAVIHDALYYHQAVNGRAITREQADAVFLEGMTALGLPWLRRQILHKAVRSGGWIAWGKCSKEAADRLAQGAKTP